MKTSLLVMILACLLMSCKKRFERRLASQDGQWIVYKVHSRYNKNTKALIDSRNDTIKIVFSKNGKAVYYRPVKSSDAHSFTYKIGISNDLGGFGKTPYVEFSGDPPFYETMYIKKSSRNYQHWENNDWPLFADYETKISADFRRE